VKAQIKCLNVKIQFLLKEIDGRYRWDRWIDGRSDSRTDTQAEKLKAIYPGRYL
jgi:hypothetical protein